MKYQCSVCKHSGLKLWRPGGVASEWDRLKCAACLVPNAYLNERGQIWDETVGWNDRLSDDASGDTWFPACPCFELDLGFGFWGYTSVPKSAVDKWKALPTYLTKISLDEYKNLRLNSYEHMAIIHRLTDEAAIYDARNSIKNAAELANRLEARYGGPEVCYFEDLSHNFLKENEKLESGLKYHKSNSEIADKNLDAAMACIRNIASAVGDDSEKSKQWGEPFAKTANRALAAIVVLQNKLAELAQVKTHLEDQINSKVCCCPHLAPCNHHKAYGDWRSSEARKEVFAKIRQAYYDGQKTDIDKFDRYLNSAIEKVEAEYLK